MMSNRDAATEGKGKNRPSERRVCPYKSNSYMP